MLRQVCSMTPWPRFRISSRPPPRIRCCGLSAQRCWSRCGYLRLLRTTEDAMDDDSLFFAFQTHLTNPLRNELLAQIVQCCFADEDTTLARRDTEVCTFLL